MKILFGIGVIMLMVANIGGIGYGLYLWGAAGLTFATAAWLAFKFWLIWIILGFVITAAGIFIIELKD